MREKLQTCQFQVLATKGKSGWEMDCGEVSVAKWTFDDGSSMYVCEEHDEVVEESEYVKQEASDA